MTATAICGSDLHIYRGEGPGMMDGEMLGSWPWGVEEEEHPDGTALRPGDMGFVAELLHGSL